MIHSFINILGSFVILAMVSVALRGSSQTVPVVGAFFGGFAQTLRSATGQTQGRKA